MICPLKVCESKESGTYYILDSHSCYVCGDMRKETADYIVLAVNSHWNLVEYKHYVHARIADGRPIMTYSKWLDAIDECEQTLKEMEK